jgi:hypothetical protein
MTWPTKTDFVDGDVLTATQVNNIGTNLNLYNPTSATSGQVPIADGAGSVAFGDVVAGAYTLITSGTISAATTTDITSITQAYKHLEVWLYDINISSNGDIRIDMYDGTFPGSSGYTVSESIQAASSTVTAGGTQGAYGFLRLFDFGQMGSGYLRNFYRGRFYDYASTSVVNKFAEGFASYQSSGGSAYVSLTTTANLKQDSAVGLDVVRIVGSSSITAASYKIWGIN